jgi:hypothetical protein
MPETPAAQPRRYDVCFFLNRRRALHKLDRGVTLGSGNVSCTADGETRDEPFGAIAAVHLKTCGPKSDVESCTVTFADDNVLTVLNCDPGGYADADLARNYRAFVQDLHAQLAAGGYRGIRFTEGWPLWRCQAMFAFAVFTALVFTGFGLWLLYRLGDLPRGLGLLALGGYGSWRLYRVTLNNVPRDYTPDRLPEFLLT